MKKIKYLIVFGTVISFMYLYTVQLVDTDIINIEKMTTLKIEQKVKLFVYNNCYYCDKVTSFLNSHNLLDQVELIDASLADNLKLLRSVSSRTQAPYLVDIDANIKMAESDDIIEYFIKKYNIQYNVPTTDALLLKNSKNQQSYTSTTFLSDVKSSKKPVIILVSTTWCPPCKIFKPIFLQLAQEYAKQCEFVCIDGDTDMLIAQELGVNCYPSIVCYKNGQQMNPKNYRSREGLCNLIKELTQY